MGFFGVGLLILLILVVFLVQANSASRDEISQKVAVPELRLTLNDVTLDEIKENGKEIKYSGNNLALGDLGFDDVEIKGRGNTTWAQVKKPYQLKLSQKADLLGLGKMRKWILISSYWDNTNLRTDTAFYLAKMVGEKFAHSGEFVELYVNDEYEGLYYLTQGIAVSKNAVDLKDPLGVLVELDNIYGENENSFFVSDNGERLTVEDTVAQDNLELAMAYFMESFNALEEAVQAKDYAKITETIDVESFAEYYLISEFAANPDAYFTSQYFYKDGPEDKIHAGPVWDFDIAFNNTLVRDWFAADGDMTRHIAKDYFENSDEQYGQWSRLFARLIDLPEFRAEVNRVFQERLSGRKNELLTHFWQQAAKIYNAATRDSEKWEKEDFVRGVKGLLEWLNGRYDYFEMEYGTKKYKNYPFYDINVVEV